IGRSPQSNAGFRKAGERGALTAKQEILPIGRDRGLPGESFCLELNQKTAERLFESASARGDGWQRLPRKSRFHMMMHTIPPLESFTIFCIESCSFTWLSSLIMAILFFIPSITRSSTDFPKIFVPHTPSGVS